MRRAPLAARAGVTVLAVLCLHAGPGGSAALAASSGADPAPTQSCTTQPYWLAGADGSVPGFGCAPDYGSMAGRRLAAPVVGMAAGPAGYRLAGADGGVFSFGGDGYYGSMAGTRLVSPIVAIGDTPDGRGYWLLGRDGSVFSFGDARFYGRGVYAPACGGPGQGCPGSSPVLSAPAVALVGTADGGGYWMATADGGVFSFGDATFHGSLGGLRPAAPIVSMARTADGGGYWLAGADGGVFAFGDAPWPGSAAGVARSRIVSLAVAPASAACAGPAPSSGPHQGYWLASAAGGVFSFGDAQFQGGGAGGPAPVVAMAAPPGAASCPGAAAEASYAALQRHLYLPTEQLYRGEGTPFSYLWPFTNAMAGTEYLADAPEGGRHIGDVADRLSGLRRYLDTGEVSPSGQAQPPAFQSAVGPPLGPGGDTYYDDNAWAALDLVHYYRLTGDRAALQLAEQTFAFIESGWSTDPNAPCPGGVYWIDSSKSFQRNTTSTAPAAEAGVELYRAGAGATYLDWSERMYAWVTQCLAAPAGTADAGMYYDHINPDGTVNTTLWSYNQGSMIAAGVLLAQATGDRTYLQNAVQTAQASSAHYGTGPQLYSQGPAFNGIYFRDLFLLDGAAPDSGYRAEAQTYADYMWGNERDPSTGLFSSTWGPGTTPRYDVNGAAPVAELDALLASWPASG